MSVKNIITILFIMIAGLTACDRYLDQPVPDTAISQKQITEQDVPLLLNGVYKTTLSSWPPQSYPMTDIYSDDIVSIQGGNPAQFNPQAYEACEPYPADGFGIGRYYSSAYGTVGNANFLINFIRQRNNPALHQALGEALTLRAFAFLQLAEIFGGVIITTQSETDINVIRRNKQPEQEVYDTIISQLQQAIPLMGDFTSPNRMSKQSAQLLLARVLLQRDRAPEAQTLATAVITSGKRQLLTGSFSPIFRFNSSAREMLFQTAEGPVQSAYDRYGLFSLYSPPAPFRGNGTGLTWMDDQLVALYETSDTRREVIRMQMNGTVGRQLNYLLKYSGDTLQAAGNVYCIYPQLRISEAYLIAAEAAARQGIVDVTYFNELRAARNASIQSAGDFASPEAFLAEIEKERRRELVGEGRRWQDMRRFKSALPFLKDKGRDSTRLYFPFPATELTRNIKLDQNDGY
ncbi:RagB/SusD family nutrient uptake outer membrane protein [uncultured Chitinophaga sp.]|uniref:RagB/SusD family nutrient uptake outer membrane protein n=1 Tax=uncultured Chitinophaga sp. TaxID=339340 RepID=UPI0025CBE1CA|nr:RagB/SusD family nutrient uptake outer membrane protein [uncultured Chitinophaga sp.]